MRDQEVIDAADERGVAMVLIGRAPLPALRRRRAAAARAVRGAQQARARIRANGHFMRPPSSVANDPARCALDRRARCLPRCAPRSRSPPRTAPARCRRRDPAGRGTGVLNFGAVALHHRRVVLRQRVEQEEAEHAAFAVGAERHALGGRRRLQAVDQRARLLRQRLVEAGLARSPCRVARPQAVATGLPDSVPAWYTGPSGASCSMIARGPPKAASGMPPPITLPSTVRSGVMPHARPARRAGRRGSRSSPRRTPAARRAACTARGSACAKGGAGAHEVHVAGDRPRSSGRRCRAPCSAKASSSCARLLYSRTSVCCTTSGGTPARGRIAEGREARARLDQQRVGMAVVAAFELDDVLAAGGAARQAHRAHRRFGAGAHQAHHLHRRHQREDGLGQFDLALGRRAEGEAFAHGALHRLDHAPDGRGPGSSGPRSRCSRCSACRRRPRSRRPARAARSAACRRRP